MLQLPIPSRLRLEQDVVFQQLLLACPRCFTSCCTAWFHLVLVLADPTFGTIPLASQQALVAVALISAGVLFAPKTGHTTSCSDIAIHYGIEKSKILPLFFVRAETDDLRFVCLSDESVGLGKSLGTAAAQHLNCPGLMHYKVYF
jgi:hypothetical protein